MLVFMEGGKLEYLEKNPQSKDRNQQQTQPTMYDSAHWWDALTTAPSLLSLQEPTICQNWPASLLNLLILCHHLSELVDQTGQFVDSVHPSDGPVGTGLEKATF